jgi:hypothetical protein
MSANTSPIKSNTTAIDKPIVEALLSSEPLLMIVFCIMVALLEMSLEMVVVGLGIIVVVVVVVVMVVVEVIVRDVVVLVVIVMVVEVIVRDDDVVVEETNPNSIKSDKLKSASAQAIQPCFRTTVYPDLYRWWSVLQEHVFVSWEHPRRFGARPLQKSTS